MRPRRISATILVPALLLSACVSQPMGPTVQVMPTQGKPFDVFRNEQSTCEQYASSQVQGNAQQANNQQVGTAVGGTLLGAGVGALLGGGRGAATGAAIGAVGGTAIGAGGAQQAQYTIQQRYNMAYSQCMYSYDNQVVGYRPPPPPPPPGYAPQPGYPPPPPRPSVY